MFNKTTCAICGTLDNSKLVFKGTVSPEDISYETFSARRIPDRKFYTWVRCLACGLLRSDPVMQIDLTDLYTESSFDYTSEVDGLKKTYLSLIVKMCTSLNPNSRFLEIGGGNGFVLEALVDSGFGNVWGIEPSKPAVAQSRADIMPNMSVEMLTADLIPPASQDVIAMFHVLDHLPDPLESLEIMHSALVPGGTVIVAVHNEKSWSARILRTRSPIYDVEHTYLYSKSSAIKLFEAAKFTAVSARSYKNHYSLGYIIQLFPLPIKIKKYLLKSDLFRFIYKINLRVGLGNMVVVGIKK